MKIQNPHDKFFKETFSNVEIAKDFLNNYLPESVMKIIDINSLESQKDSFINEELQEGFSDMLFRVNINKREGYIYFLFEHKSYANKDISFQLLKYMIDIWESKIKKERNYELPIIIPLVIYHGKENWNMSTTLGEMVLGYNELPKYIQKFIPNYEYLLYDISKYKDEEIKGQAQLRIILTIFRDIFTKDNKGLQETIFRAVEYLQELENKQTGIEYFETLIRYIFNASSSLTKNDINDIIDKVGKTYPEGSELVMTLADMFREEGIMEGIEKGIEKGIQQGEYRKSLNYVIKLLTKKFGKLPGDYRQKLNSANIEILDLIIDEIFSLESLDDIDKYL